LTPQLLLDTCAAIWITERAPISAAAIEAMGASFDIGLPVLVSPITAWERGLLVSKGRVASPVSPLTWFDRLTTEAQLSVSPLTPQILIDSSFLPGPIHNDPADRIIIATARALDLTIVTRDRLILDYAARGHVRGLAC
jgi:PIN domain nuclease of toxin-antitoxin system